MERGITHCKNCLKKLSSSEFEFCDRCKSEMSDKNIDKDIEILKEINEKNNFIFYEKVNNVFETLKKNEFPLQFKSDLTDVIDALINNQINSNVLSACEMTMKNQTYEIQKEKENCYKKRIEFLNSELETYKEEFKKINKALNLEEEIVEPYTVDIIEGLKGCVTQQKAELETYKKIAEKLAEELSKHIWLNDKDAILKIYREKVEEDETHS